MFQRQRPRLDLLHVVNDGSVIHRISPLGREFSTFWYEISSGTVRTEQATIDQAQARNAFRGHRLVRRSANRLNPAPACECSAGGSFRISPAVVDRPAARPVAVDQLW